MVDLGVLTLVNLTNHGDWFVACLLLWGIVHIYAVRALVPYMAHIVVFSIPKLRFALLGGGMVMVSSVAFILFVNGPAFRTTAMDLMDTFLFILASRLLLEFDNHRRKAREQQRIKADRDRIAHDVHELLGKSLTTVVAKAQDIERTSVNPELRRQAAEITDISHQAMRELRYTVAAQHALETAGIAVVINRTGELQHPEFSWVLREAVTNVIRHSHATRCVIDIGDNRLVVHDNGVGLGDNKHGNVLRGVTERISQAGGTLDIDQRGGTTVTAVLPR